jgi:Trk-type K+ transport system membrane component
VGVLFREGQEIRPVDMVHSGKAGAGYQRYDSKGSFAHAVQHGRKVGVLFRALFFVLLQSVWGYFALYMITFVICGLWMIHAGLEPVSAFSAVATSINNLGPGLGEVAYSFQGVSDQGKLVAVAAMLLGRLEIFTILVLLMPEFWRG